jgi:hypothetical protein
LLLLHATYLILSVWASYVAWRAGALQRRLVISVWGIALYFWGMTTLALPIARYMVPAMGLLFLLAPGVLQRSRKHPDADYA